MDRRNFLATVAAGAGALTLPTGLLAGGVGGAAAQVLFRDDFSGSALNMSKWQIPTGAPSNYGRTQQRPPSNPPKVVGGVLRLQLDLFNPSARIPGDSFFGSEVFTKQTFPRGRGLAFEARLRFVSPIPRGLVAGFYPYIVSGSVRDELDFELLSNDLNAGRKRVLTNSFNNADFNQPGDKAFVNLAKSLSEFNTYRIEWLPDHIDWYINGSLVRQEFDTVPDQAMQLHLNIWAPDQFFVEAFDAGLKPVAKASQNKQYFCEVDYVSVTAK